MMKPSVTTFALRQSSLGSLRILSGVTRLIANHRSLAPSKAHQKSGPFPPPALPGLTGRTALSDSRPARRAHHGVGGATSGRNGPPPITRTTFPTCRAHYPGGSERVHASVPGSPRHPGQRCRSPYASQLRPNQRSIPLLSSIVGNATRPNQLEPRHFQDRRTAKKIFTPGQLRILQLVH